MHFNKQKQFFKLTVFFLYNVSYTKELDQSNSPFSAEGGLFIWVTLPERFDGNEIARLATEKLVAVVPGSSFEPDVNAKSHSFRLNYSMPSDEQIIEGVDRLAEALYSLENK